MHASFREGFEKAAFLYADPNKYKAALRAGITTNPKSLAKSLVQGGRESQENQNTLRRITARGENAATQELKSRGYTQGTRRPTISQEFMDNAQIGVDSKRGFYTSGPSTNTVVRELQRFRQRLKE